MHNPSDLFCSLILYVYRTKIKIEPWYILSLHCFHLATTMSQWHLLLVAACAPGAEGVCFLWTCVKTCHHLSTVLVTHKNGLKLEQAIIMSIAYFALYPSNFWAHSLHVILEEVKRLLALYYGLVWSHVRGWSISALLDYKQRGIN